MEYHNPVLLKESIELLNVKPGGVYVDVTFGGGGHSKAILEGLDENGKLFAFDKDGDAEANRFPDLRLTLIRSDYRFIEKELTERGIAQVDGILADLGISSHQIDDPTRGFSYRFDAELDLRMDRRQEETVADLLNNDSMEDLRQIFREYGELDNAHRLAGEIVRAREGKPIMRTGDLEDAIRKMIPRERAKFLSKVYQALRIAVNDELGGLADLLTGGLKMLAPEGRMVIIAYHSLEDRMVKRFFRDGNLEGKDERDLFGNSLNPLKVITRQAVVPGADELASNTRSRSAKLRAAEKR